MKKLIKKLVVGILFGILYFGVLMPVFVRFKVNHMNLPDGCRQVKTITSWVDIFGGHFAGWRLFETENSNEQEVWDEIRKKNKKLEKKFGEFDDSHEMVIFFNFSGLSREPREYEDEPLGRLVKYAEEDSTKHYYVLEYFIWDTVEVFIVVYLVIFLFLVASNLLYGKKYKIQNRKKLWSTFPEKNMKLYK